MAIDHSHQIGHVDGEKSFRNVPLISVFIEKDGTP
jgi:hypothetical protein